MAYEEQALARLLAYDSNSLSGGISGIFDSLFQGDEARIDHVAMMTAIRTVESIFQHHRLPAEARSIRQAAQDAFKRAIAFAESASASGVEMGGGGPGGGRGQASEGDESTKAVASFERLNPEDWRDRDFIIDPEGQLAGDMDRVIRWTANVASYLALDIDAPTGILLIGPPGTGKTVAAHRIAARNGKRLLIGRHDAIQHHLLGQNMKNFRALIEAAEKEDAYLFLDEVDGLARDRSLAGPTDGHRIELLESILEQLTILKRRKPDQVIFAATNIPEALDPAFVRRMAITLEFTFLSKPARRSLVEALYTNVNVDPDAMELMLERSEGKSADFLRSVAMSGGRLAIDELGDEDRRRLAEAYAVTRAGKAEEAPPIGLQSDAPPADQPIEPVIRPRVTREHVGAALKLIKDRHDGKTQQRTHGGAILLGGGK